LIQIRNIDGLDPVKAAINTSLYGSVDGAAYVGGSVAARNIVLTVHPNPDWDNWSYEALRKLLYAYFMPKKSTRLEFESDDLAPVGISGIVEDITVNQFSKDQEFLVSVICPDPYFVALDPTVLTGQTNAEGPTVIEYEGTIETGFNVKVTFVSGTVPTAIEVQVGEPPVTDLVVTAGVDATKYYELNSVAMRKYVQNIAIGGGTITNLLPKVLEGSSWPMLQPGENDIFITTTPYGGIQDWELTYYERFGGL